MSSDSAAAVRRWREQCGLTQEQAADKLGITTRALKGYEAGEYPPAEPVRRLMTAVAAGMTPEPWPINKRA